MRAEHLLPHPEGGRYREVYRSATPVKTRLGNRAAATHIYFSLEPDEISRFHRVDADEVWNLYRGHLRLIIADPDGRHVREVELSPATEHFCEVVPAGHWQAAAPVDGNVLVGCTVAPGFEFEGFELLTADSTVAQAIRDNGNRWTPFIGP